MPPGKALIFAIDDVALTSVRKRKTVSFVVSYFKKNLFQALGR